MTQDAKNATVIEYNWTRGPDDDSGTCKLAVPADCDERSFLKGFAAADAESGIEISGWRKRPDLKAWRVDHSVTWDERYQPEHRVWTVFHQTQEEARAAFTNPKTQIHSIEQI